MTTFLLDTNVLIDFFKKKPFAQDLVRRLERDGNLTISVLTIAELRSGWSQKQAFFFLPKLYRLVERKHINEVIAEKAGALRQMYKMRGTSLPTIDTLIAATALIEDCQLVTNNQKDYPIPGLTFFRRESH